MCVLDHGIGPFTCKKVWLIWLLFLIIRWFGAFGNGSLASHSRSFWSVSQKNCFFERHFFQAWLKSIFLTLWSYGLKYWTHVAHGSCPDTYGVSIGFKIICIVMLIFWFFQTIFYQKLTFWAATFVIYYDFTLPYVLFIYLTMH